MLSDVSGMLCDGAKSTCALKIATGLAAAIECVTLAMNGIAPTSKDGIVFDDAVDVENAGFTYTEIFEEE